MPFQNYYIGSDLNNLGAQMQQDRDTGARSEIARMEQQRLAYAAFMQQLQQRQAQAQQAQQFQQELAFRSHGQGQENQYRNAMLGLKREEMNQFGPRDLADNTYRYAALQNALEQSRLQSAVPGQQALSAMINQQGMTDRAGQESQELRELEESSVKAKQSQYNTMLEQIDQDAKEVERKHDPWGWTTGEDKQRAGETYRRQKYQELLQMLQLDKRPGDIAMNPQTQRFESALPVRKPAQPGINPLNFGPSQTNTVTGIDPRQAALIQALQGGQPQIQSNNAPPAVVTVPGPQQGYQSEVSQLQAAARSGLIDRATYAQRRREIDTKYGVFSR